METYSLWGWSVFKSRRLVGMVLGKATNETDQEPISSASVKGSTQFGEGGVVCRLGLTRCMKSV